jgi:uncharacterized protein
MAYLKPLPEIREENRPFFDGLRAERFLVPRCENGHYNWPPMPACRTCLSEELAWTEVSGRGELWSYTVVHRGPGAFDDDVPYVVALVKLEEHPRSLLVLGNVVRGADSLAIGAPMQITYEDIPGEDVTLWRFAPEGDDWSPGEDVLAAGSTTESGV